MVLFSFYKPIYSSAILRASGARFVDRQLRPKLSCLDPHPLCRVWWLVAPYGDAYPWPRRFAVESSSTLREVISFLFFVSYIYSSSLPHVQKVCLYLFTWTVVTFCSSKEEVGARGEEEIHRCFFALCFYSLG
jgi:hypothetical protein